MSTIHDDTATTWRDLADQLRAEEFDRTVAAWNTPLRCEIPTQSGDRCQRLAYWRINLHGCEQSLACGQHLSAWKRAGSANMRAGYLPRCAHCGQTFANFANAYTVTPL